MKNEIIELSQVPEYCKRHPDARVVWDSKPKTVLIGDDDVIRLLPVPSRPIQDVAVEYIHREEGAKAAADFVAKCQRRGASTNFVIAVVLSVGMGGLGAALALLLARQ